MILVDRRIGSGHLVEDLTAGGLEAELGDLEAGDALVIGAKGGFIAVELKRLGDLIRVVNDGRFAGSQLPRMRRAYGRDIVLMVEGEYRRGEGGAIETRKGSGWSMPPYAKTTGYDRLEAWVDTMRFKGQLQIVFTLSERHTVAAFERLQRWVDRYHEHRSHLAFDDSAPEADEWAEAGSGAPWQVDMLRKAPGLGPERAAAAIRHFGTVLGVVQAPWTALVEVEGIGKKTAQRFERAMREEVR